MKNAHVIIGIGAVALVALVAIKRMSALAKKGATGGTPTPALAPATIVQITEAAFHQDSADMAPAFGTDENTNGEEVTSLL